MGFQESQVRGKLMWSDSKIRILVETKYRLIQLNSRSCLSGLQGKREVPIYSSCNSYSCMKMTVDHNGMRCGRDTVQFKPFVERICSKYLESLGMCLDSMCTAPQIRSNLHQRRSQHPEEEREYSNSTELNVEKGILCNMESSMKDPHLEYGQRRLT
jgi:hypothetical protein